MTKAYKASGPWNTTRHRQSERWCEMQRGRSSGWWLTSSNVTWLWAVMVSPTTCRSAASGLQWPRLRAARLRPYRLLGAARNATRRRQGIVPPATHPDRNRAWRVTLVLRSLASDRALALTGGDGHNDRNAQVAWNWGCLSRFHFIRYLRILGGCFV